MPTNREGGAKRGGRRFPTRGQVGRSPAPTGRRPQGPGAPRPGGLSVRPIADNDFELVHPRCAQERRDDYEEGLDVWRHGEPEEAREILRFALQGCGDNLWIHAALGRLALEVDRDPALARGHFGYVVELVRKALPRAFAGRLPRQRPANRPLYDTLDGLITCLEALGRPADVAELRALAAAWTGETAR